MPQKIKLFDPSVNRLEEKAVLTVLKSHLWASGGGSPNVLDFENKFRKYVSSKNCISVNSGTAALHLALSLFNVKNKEIILPSLSFVSTSHSILYNNAKPVFVDINKDTLNINHQLIEDKINKKTGALLPVHYGGMPCEIDKILAIAKNHDIPIVEDAAHAAGTSFKNKKIGSHGDAVCFSFHPVKNLAMPTGGAITLNRNNKLNAIKKLKSRRWCGIQNRKGTSYDVTELGWNFYMNEFAAAIGLQQLKKLDRMNSKRKRIAKRYFKEINVPEKMSYSEDCSYHLFWILVKNRNLFRKKMEENGIETGTHYKPIHQMKLYKSKIKLPVTDYVAEKIVTIPIHPNLSENQVSLIIKNINKFAQ